MPYRHEKVLESGNGNGNGNGEEIEWPPQQEKGKALGLINVTTWSTEACMFVAPAWNLSGGVGSSHWTETVRVPRTAVVHVLAPSI